MAGILGMAFYAATAKRIPALLRAFRVQSIFIFGYMLVLAIKGHSLEFYAVAGLLFLIKVVFIPYYLHRTMVKVRTEDSLGLYVNPAVSLFAAMGLTYLAFVFTGRGSPESMSAAEMPLTVSFALVLIGVFVMVFKKKAICQIVGLLIMENGIFLAATAFSHGMPFFVEIAVFFDIFVCVVIQGIFVRKMNKMFTHIDADKLTRLKG